MEIEIKNGELGEYQTLCECGVNMDRIGFIRTQEFKTETLSGVLQVYLYQCSHCLKVKME